MQVGIQNGNVLKKRNVGVRTLTEGTTKYPYTNISATHAKRRGHLLCLLRVRSIFLVVLP